MISKRERLEAAIAGDLADRPPVALWRHFPVDDQFPQELARSTAAFQRTFDFDFVKLTPASSFCLKDWGVEDRWDGGMEGTRTYIRRVIENVSDWASLSLLAPHEGALGAQLECIRLLHEDLGADVPIAQTIFSPLAQAKNLAGGERLLEHLKQDEGAVREGLRTIAASTIDFVAAAISQGIDGIFYAIQHASSEILDRDDYRRIAEEHDRAILEAAGDLWLNILHLHGKGVFFDLASAYPVQVVNWHDRETEPGLTDGAKLLSGAVCGGVHRETLSLGVPDQVREEAREAIDALHGRGLILGTGCVTPIITSWANMRAFRESVECA